MYTLFNKKNEKSGECTNEKLVDAHASINGDFAAEIALEFLLFHRLWSIVRQKLC